MTEGRQPPDLNVWRKALGRLKRDGVARRADVSLKLTGGRRANREFAHFLSDARKGEAIVRGARNCGIKSRTKAKNDYGRVGLPGNHARVRNDLFIALRLHAAAANGRVGRVVAEVPLEDMWAESCPEFPLRGAKITTDDGGRRLTGFEFQKAGYHALEPDGRFRVRFPAGGPNRTDLECTFDVELETGTRSGEVVSKIDERAGCYLRLLDLRRRSENERRGRARLPGPLPDEFLGLPEGMVPLLFWLPSDASAKNMRDRVLAALAEGDEALSSFNELRERPELVPLKKTREGVGYFEGGADVGRYVLFGGAENVEAAPFGPVYYPLCKYPPEHQPVGGGGRVSIPVIAHEMAEARAGRARHRLEDWTDGSRDG